MKVRIEKRRASKAPGAIFALILLTAMPVAYAGCGNVSLIGRQTLESRSRTEAIVLVGSVEDVDFSRREIYLRTNERQSQVVSYTDETRVIVDGKEAPASRVRTGDLVEVRLQETSSGRAVAEFIRVRDSGRARNETIEGTVERVLSERGVIELRTASGEMTTVYLPQASSDRTEEQFRRMSVGDFVRLEGIWLGDNRFELTGVL